MALTLAFSAPVCKADTPPIQTTLCEIYRHGDEFSGKRIALHAFLVAIGDPAGSNLLLTIADPSCPNSMSLVDYIEDISNWNSVLVALRVNGQSDVEGDYVGKALWSPKRDGEYIVYVDKASNLKSVPPRDWGQLQKAQ